MTDEDEERYFGKYKGYVRRNDDPERRGRIVCFCPQVMGTTDGRDHWLGWAEPCHQWVGGLPLAYSGSPFTRDEQVRDFGSEWFGVWLEFEGGDPDFPIWTGVFLVAPRPTSTQALDFYTSGPMARVGGGALSSSESEVASIYPPTALAGRELRLVAPKGVDIVLISQDGSAIICGRSGVHITAPQITLNGSLWFASSLDGG